MNWATRKGAVGYEVVVWSKSDQRVTDRLAVDTSAEGRDLVIDIKQGDQDLNAWVRPLVMMEKAE